MRKRIIMGVAGATLFLAGMLAGVMIGGGIPAFASKGTNNADSVNSVSQSHSATANGYCQTYEQTLANKLNVSMTTLENDNTAALEAVITQMANDKTITSVQESALQQLVTKYSANPCSHLGQLAQLARGKKSGALNQVLAGARQSIATKVAAALGISTATLASDLKTQTIKQIAADRNVQLTTVNTAYLNAVQGLLAQAVTNGYLTQNQSNALDTRITDAVKAGHYPLLEGGAKLATSTPTAGA